MIFKHNYLYSLLVDGNSDYRSSQMCSCTDDILKTYIKCLCPDHLSSKQKAFLSEFYIKLIYMNPELLSLLYKVDPYNSYADIDYNIILNDDERVDMNELLSNITPITHNIAPKGAVVIEHFQTLLKSIVQRLL